MRIYESPGDSIIAMEMDTTEEEVWVEDYISPDGWQPDYPQRLVVEVRYAADIIEAARLDGFSVYRA